MALFDNYISVIDLAAYASAIGVTLILLLHAFLALVNGRQVWQASRAGKPATA